MTEENRDTPVPPYEGRKTEAEAGDTTHREGARTGGATAPVGDDEPKAPDPAATPRGAAASPADEQPAADTPSGGSEEAATGPSHTPGNPKGEDQG